MKKIIIWQLCILYIKTLVMMSGKTHKSWSWLIWRYITYRNQHHFFIYLFYLLDDSMLDLDVLKDRLDYHVHVLEVSIWQRWVQHRHGVNSSKPGQHTTESDRLDTGSTLLHWLEMPVWEQQTRSLPQPDWFYQNEQAELSLCPYISFSASVSMLYSKDINQSTWKTSTS